MSRRRCFRFAYLTSGHKDREQYPFQLRDGDAALYLTHALAGRGYEYTGPIVNYPSPGPDIVPFDHSFLLESDLILLTTRPPMHDDQLGDKKAIRRSFTELEERLFTGPLRAGFERCSRSEILLSSAVADVSLEIAERRSMVFRQQRGATFDSYGSPVTRKWRRFKRRDKLTAAFLLYAEHAWPGGPALLAAFGMGGTETLVWCYQLATRFQHLLCTTPFAMAEMRTGVLAERPETISFADSWEIKFVGGAEPPLAA